MSFFEKSLLTLELPAVLNMLSAEAVSEPAKELAAKLEPSPYEGEVLVYDGPNDANGDWYGFPAEKFTETLHDAGYIDKKTEEEIVKRDKDGYVWVNGGYVELHGTETENTGANS